LYSIKIKYLANQVNLWENKPCLLYGADGVELELENSKKTIKGYWISWGILAGLFIYMFSLNFLMPLHRDDYEYSLIWGTLQRITTMQEVFQSLQLHYFAHGGRMIDFFVLDSFLLWGKQWFNPFNAFLFVFLMILIYWHSQHKVTMRLNPYILGLIILFCWFGLPDFALVNIWMTGSCVYLLTAVLIFSFLLPYHFEFLGKPIVGNGYITSIGMFLFGIVAGWTVENTAATMVMIIAAIDFFVYKKKRLKKWMTAGLAGAVIGFLLLVVAPGNYVRYENHKTALQQHVLNQIGGSIEILVGLLPAIIFLVLAWKIVLVEYGKLAKKTRMDEQPNCLNCVGIASLIRMVLICLMLFSKLNESFLSCWMSRFLCVNVARFFGSMDDSLQEKLFTILSGMEELMIYLLIIIQFSTYIFRKCKLGKNDLEYISYKAAFQGLLSVHPISYYIVGLLGIACINNLVMLAAPSFPGRAGYGSAVFFIIGIMMMFQIPKVKEFLLHSTNKRNLAKVVAIGVIPMAALVFYQYMILHIENNERMMLMEMQRAQETTSSLEMKPVSLKNEILRHVYFVDLNNSVSKYGFCRYFEIKELKVIETLEIKKCE
jgi:hypothetical protein